MATSESTSRVPKPYWFGSLPDHALVRELRVSHEQDRANTARLIALLAEVERRRLHRDQGHASLFKYCVHALHMSEDMAWKRIQVSRAARRHPAIFKRLADERLTLTAVLLLDQHLTHENAAALLDAATHLSKNAVLELLASRFPQPDLACLITPVVAPPTAPVLSADMPHATPVASHATSPAPERVPDIPGTRADVRVSPALPIPTPPARVTPLAPERFALQVTLSLETRDKLRRAQELLGHALPDGDIAHVLDRALELLIAKLESKRCGRTASPLPRRSHANGRYVPAEIKRQVFERDMHQCAYVSDQGKRCDARSGLELDHVIPLARGGRTELANLRLLCRAHNQMQAERVLGRGFMDSRRPAPREPDEPANTPRLPDPHE